jgi:ABC-2 type transport system permease protein
VRGILLKGNGAAQIGQELWPIALFAAVAIVLGVGRYQKTLD